MDPIKESFSKVKQDIAGIKQDISNLQRELSSTRNFMIEICEVIKTISENLQNKKDFQNQKDFQNNINKFSNDLDKNRVLTPTNRQTNQQTNPRIIPTDTQQISSSPTDTSTHNSNIKPLNGQNQVFSTGNQGVPTDRQTDRQTDRHINNPQNNPYNNFQNNPQNNTQNNPYNNFQNNPQNNLNIPKEELSQENMNSQKTLQNPVDNASELLESLDSIKKELRLKFKRLTDQEMLVFSTLYQLDQESQSTQNKEEKGTNYRQISDKLNLSESSIRDYVGRLIKKGIPISKKKLNNKAISLSISDNFKKIASLNTILKLREI